MSGSVRGMTESVENKVDNYLPVAFIELEMTEKSGSKRHKKENLMKNADGSGCPS